MGILLVCCYFIGSEFVVYKLAGAVRSEWAVALVGGAFDDSVRVHQSCLMVTNRISGRRSRDLAIQSECVKFQQSDGGETVKLGSNGVHNRS